jgi:hypothetical protein
MLTFFVAAAAGWAVGRRSSPFTWIVGAVLVTAICIAVAVAGWSLNSVLEGLVGLVAFNVVALLGAVARTREIAPALRSPVKGHEARARLQPVPKTWA